MVFRLVLVLALAVLGAQPLAAQSGTELIRGNAYELSLRAQTEAEYTRVIELCEEGIETGAPPSAQQYAEQLMSWALNRRGQLRLDREQNEAALADFNRAVELDPTRFLAFHNRGVIRASEGDFDKALEDWNQAIRLRPSFSKALRNRGELHYARGDLERAVSDYTAALRSGSDEQAELYGLRGHAYYMLGRNSQALMDYNRALQTDRRLWETYIHRGDLLQDMGRWDRAINDYQAALRWRRDSHRALVSLAWLRSTCPDAEYRSPEEGVQAAQQALEMLGEESPDLRHRYLDVLAAAHANAGEFEEAIQIQEEALTLAPEEMRQDYQKRLDLYQGGEPYRVGARST